MLTFIEERRQRIRKARVEGYAKGFEEGRIAGREEGRIAGREEGRIAGIEEARAEILAILRRNPRIDAMIRDDPEFRATLRDLGFDLRDDEKNGGAQPRRKSTGG